MRATMRPRPWKAAALALTVIAGASGGTLTGAHLGAQLRDRLDAASAARLTAAATSTCRGGCGPGGRALFTAVPYSGTQPARIQFSGDGGDVVSGIRWASWGRQEAVGAGTVGIDNCRPDCAEGRTSYVPATITLSDPATDGTRVVWTSMTEVYDGRSLEFSLSGTRAQGAR